MKRAIVATIIAIGITTAAYAATEDKWFVTVDTVGNCSIAQGKPSEGQKALGEVNGYASIGEARSHLDTIRDDENHCKGVVG
jgi:hypothetical protein